MSTVLQRLGGNTIGETMYILSQAQKYLHCSSGGIISSHNDDNNDDDFATIKTRARWWEMTHCMLCMKDTKYGVSVGCVAQNFPSNWDICLATFGGGNATS